MILISILWRVSHLLVIAHLFSTHLIIHFSVDSLNVLYVLTQICNNNFHLSYDCFQFLLSVLSDQPKQLQP